MMKNIGTQLYFFGLILLVVIILLSLFFKSCFANELPGAFRKQVEEQQNPFRISKDSAAIVWQRAALFFKERKGIIVGGQLRVNDSMYYLPYYNDYQKGDCVKIAKRDVGDVIEITCTWCYSRDTSESGGKEIALFLQRGIGRYGYEQ